MAAITSTSAGFRLENHASSMAQLSNTMQRLGAEMSPERFLEAVATAFQELQARLKTEDLHRRFREETSYSDFKDGLEYARGDCKKPLSVLILGCGMGFAGQEASFAAGVVREVIPASELECIQEFNLTPRDLAGDARTAVTNQRFDFVVGHSLLHYIPCLGRFFAFIDKAIKRQGALLLSHEPNANFLANPACQSALQDLRADRRRRRAFRYLDPSLYLARLQRRRTPAPKLSDLVNKSLRDKYGWRNDLSDLEIRRIVDIHRPPAIAGDFKIGLDGFVLDTLVPSYIPDLRLLWCATSGHLGYNDVASLPKSWQRREQELRRAYPLAGSVVTGYWRRA
jgi:SAM-dependent methyltransferase